MNQSINNNEIPVDLIKKTGQYDWIMDRIKKYRMKLSIFHSKFKIGDKIQFYGGYNDDILFESEIIGFDDEEGIYVVWDCYWFPIKDEPKRNIKKII